jgi:hypothetical protein
MDIRQFERQCEEEIEDAISEACERIEKKAEERFVGRVIEFTHHWHSIDAETAIIRAPIDRVTVGYGDGGAVFIEVGVRVKDPRTGREVRIDRNVGNFSFVE